MTIDWRDALGKQVDALVDEAATLASALPAARAEALRYAAERQDEHTQWLKEHRSVDEPYHSIDLFRAFESDDAANALRRLADEVEAGSVTPHRYTDGARPTLSSPPDEIV